LLITNLHFKGLERNIRDVGAKKKTLFDFLIGCGTPNESMSFWVV
jgi:hypothetical protein